MDRRLPLAALLAFCLTLLTGCGYEEKITRTETPGAELLSPDPERYGGIRLLWIREYHRPTGFRKFPDGGKPKELALYAIVYQTGGDEEREVGRINLKPVQPSDFGNFNDFEHRWQAPDRLWIRIEYGYYGALNKVHEGELQLPPLR